MKNIVKLYAPILRKDDATREVEGYAFVNEDVGDGVILPRSLMEAMTDDYMKWANVREMHQPRAVGTVTTLTWDDKGALMRVKVVDDEAWKKVEEGVLRGFSVGVKLRSAVKTPDGSVRATNGVWFETSLVDRPKDPDSPFAIARMDDEAEEGEVEVTEETTETEEEEVETTEDADRGEFLDSLKSAANFWVLDAVCSRLNSALWSCLSDNRQDDMPGIIDEFKKFVTGGGLQRSETLTEAELSLLGAITPRMEAATATLQVMPAHSELVTRAETAETSVTRLEGELATVRAELEALRAEPDPTQPKPVLTFNPVERLIGRGGLPSPESAEAKAKSDADQELRALMAEDWSTKTEAEKQAAIARVAALKALVA